MGFGDVGILAFGTKRRLELPDGRDADVSAQGRAALRFDGSANQLELSIDGGAYAAIGGGASPSLSYVAWVNQRSGNDGTAQVGNFDLPYATVQAAVTAALATGQADISVGILPGAYAENVTVPAPALQTDFSIFGVGSGVQLDSIAFNAPGAGISNNWSIQDLILGRQSGGGQTASPLNVAASDGNLRLLCNSVVGFCSTANTDVVRVTNAAALGFVELYMYDSLFECVFGSPTGGRGLFAESGNIVSHNCTFRGNGQATIQLGGFCNFIDYQSVLLQGTVAPAAPLIFVPSPTIGIVYLNSTSIQTAGNNDIIFADSANAQFVINDCLNPALAYSGQAVVLNADTLVSWFKDGGGNDIPINSTGGTLQFLVGSNRIDFDGSSFVTGNTTVEDAVSDLLRGVGQTQARLTGGGAFAAGDNQLLLVDEGAVPTTIALPARSTVTDGRRIRVVDATTGGSAGITIAPNGADTINGGASTTVAVGLNNYTEVVAEAGTTNWQICGVRP